MSSIKKNWIDQLEDLNVDDKRVGFVILDVSFMYPALEGVSGPGRFAPGKQHCQLSTIRLDSLQSLSVLFDVYKNKIKIPPSPRGFRFSDVASAV